MPAGKGAEGGCLTRFAEVDSVPVLAPHLPVQGLAGLLNGCPNSRTDWQISSCWADWRLVVGVKQRAVHWLATAAPWMSATEDPAESSVNFVSDTQLQEAVPQSRHLTRASPPRWQVAVPPQAGIWEFAPLEIR